MPIVLLAVLALTAACEMMPRNTLADCRRQCPDSSKPEACYDFCACIHQRCQPLAKCLEQYEQTPATALLAPETPRSLQPDSQALSWLSTLLKMR
ncbi:hypothetical protein [Hymenobacter sp. B81]|uniref:hypothetical protein n=1 Tax=Hymenobacter sp. B81 TaxID=3344878 RepID=UPI0037DCC378